MLATAGNGGTHEGFWKVFNARLKELTDNVLIGSTLPDADAQRVWEQLTSVGDSLTGNGANTSWLSELRNSIQYRQEHGVWFPDKLPNARREILGRIALAWVKPPDEITMATTAGRLGQFLSACTFLVALCRELLVRIDLRCSVGSSFAGFGPLQYLRVRG